jgi:hypothetical protein
LVAVVVLLDRHRQRLGCAPPFPRPQVGVIAAQLRHWHPINAGELLEPPPLDACAGAFPALERLH